MEFIKLSIIVPVYNMNRDGKLTFCMDSLIKQSLSALGVSYEILAVDDCSVDDSYEALKAYEKKYPGKVRVFRTDKNRKQGGARNLGLKEAAGEWIGFMDSDDWAAPDMYEKLLMKAEESGADVVGCDYHQTGEHSMKIGKIVNANTKDQTGVLDKEKYKKLMLNPCSMVIKIYKRDVIEKYGLDFPENIFYEDNCAGPVWMLHFTHFEKVEEPLYYYYQDEASTTHAISQAKCEDRMQAGRLLVEKCKACGFYEAYQKELEFAYTKLYYVNTLFTYVIGIPHASLSFLNKLRTGMLEEFPAFEQNPYYNKVYDREQKKLIRLHMRSSSLFILYYRALTGYRKFRSTIRNKR